MTYHDEDPLAPARGVLFGLIFGALFWLAIIAIVIVWLVLR